jgi:cell division protein FtsN
MNLPQRRKPPILATSLATILAAALALAPCEEVRADTVAEARRLASDGDVGRALETVDAVLAQNPADVSARLLRGVLLSRTGRSDDAIAAFRALATSHPDLPEPHNNLAVLYAAQGRYTEARDALLEAIRLQPDYDLAHENLGDVYAKLAALSYARALQINESNRTAAAKHDAAQRITDPEPGGSRATAAVPAPPTPPARAPATQASQPVAAAASPAAVPVACVRVPASSPENVDALLAWFREQGLTAAATEGTLAPTPSAYRVLIEPLTDRAAARARVAELKSAGVRDLMLITSGEQANGISLGVFGKRSGAERRQRELAQRDISARIQPHLTGPRDSASHEVRARGRFPAPAFASAFPDVAFTIEDCP